MVYSSVAVLPTPNEFMEQLRGKMATGHEEKVQKLEVKWKNRLDDCESQLETEQTTSQTMEIHQFGILQSDGSHGIETCSATKRVATVVPGRNWQAEMPR